MYIRVRTLDGIQNAVVCVSKLSTVKELKDIISKELNIDPDSQRLLYKGKQLEDEHTMFDYNVALNDVIQILIRQNAADCSEEKIMKEDSKQNLEDFVPQKFQVNDNVEYLCDILGSWVRGQILEISKIEKVEGEKNLEYFVYKIASGLKTVEIDKEENIRLCSLSDFEMDDIQEGRTVSANYNISHPLCKGYWYNFLIEKIIKRDNIINLKGTIIVGPDLFFLPYCTVPIGNIRIICSLDGLKREVKTEDYEVNQEISEGNVGSENEMCSVCKNNARRKCKECGCAICGGKDNPEAQVMCDECDRAFHIKCLNPPLENIPEVEEWYCPACKNDENEIVKAGEKLKESKKKAKMPSANKKSNRDWGKGMACIGRSKICTIVPANHYGAVPGVEVGTTWRFRMQASETGVHRPPVSGIHGQANDGAYSIVISGGYEDDIDNGDEFTYTGSGGRDLDGNKRTAKQSKDQELTAMNMALARNCFADLSENGADAGKDWKKGKPVRVLRSGKLKSKYVDHDGYRYDGLYRVVRYYKEKGQSGFNVWRYVLRRFDPDPAPWTKEGKLRMIALGLDQIINPEGFAEAMAAKEESAKEKAEAKAEAKAAGKRRTSDVKIDEEIDGTSKTASGKKRSRKSSTNKEMPVKKMKFEFKLDDDVRGFIDDDINTKLWKECNSFVSSGKAKFLSKVMESFTCICCQELVFEPVTTTCMHNFCHSCLKRSFAADVYSCPTCRTELSSKKEVTINKNLQNILLKLFPGYEKGR